MKPIIGVARILLLSLALAGFPAEAQERPNAPVPGTAWAHRYADGLLMEHRGDERGAFLAFLEAAEAGYPPAQRRLGEIYDSGTTTTDRDYEESIRWYQKAREGGEIIPPPKARLPGSYNAP